MEVIQKLFPAVMEKEYFQHPETKEFWFHATGVCNALGYKNVSSALALHVDEDEKMQEVINGRVVWFVSEAGLYGLAMGAKTKEAKEFKRWIKHIVLPKLRSQGLYAIPKSDETLAESIFNARLTNYSKNLRPH